MLRHFDRSSILEMTCNSSTIRSVYMWKLLEAGCNNSAADREHQTETHVRKTRNSSYEHTRVVAANGGNPLIRHVVFDKIIIISSQGSRMQSRSVKPSPTREDRVPHPFVSICNYKTRLDMSRPQASQKCVDKLEGKAGGR